MTGPRFVLPYVTKETRRSSPSRVICVKGVLAVTGARLYDILSPERELIGGLSLLTDGQWFRYSDLARYVERYHVAWTGDSFSSPEAGTGARHGSPRTSSSKEEMSCSAKESPDRSPPATVGSFADVGTQQLCGQVVIVGSGQAQGGVAAWISQFGIRAERQQHGSGVHRQRPAALQGAIALGVDRVRQQRHVAEDLVRVSAVGEQAGQGFHILVLDCVVGWCPVVAHRRIQ